MGPLIYNRVDGRVITDELVCIKYFNRLNTDTYKNMLEELRVARKWNMTIEEFNEWMDEPTDDYAHKYFHDIFCKCGTGYHMDMILWGMGAMGTAHNERYRQRGSDWPDHQKVSRNAMR